MVWMASVEGSGDWKNYGELMLLLCMVGARWRLLSGVRWLTMDGSFAVGAPLSTKLPSLINYATKEVVMSKEEIRIKSVV